MYESPIDLVLKDIRIQQEGLAMKAIAETGVIVNKEELIKALQYDRDQYEKGFIDGKKAAMEEIYNWWKGNRFYFRTVVEADMALCMEIRARINEEEK